MHSQLDLGEINRRVTTELPTIMEGQKMELSPMKSPLKRTYKKRLIYILTFIFISFMILTMSAFHLKGMKISYKLPTTAIYFNETCTQPPVSSTNGLEVKSVQLRKVLVSKRNSFGMYNHINGIKDSFNPTLIQLPSNSKYDFIVIHRLPAVPEDGLHRSRVGAFFANLQENELGQWKLNRMNSNWSAELLTDLPRPERHCDEFPFYSQYFGPEDPKVVWTRKGEPLMVFTSQGIDGGCQGMSIIDVRSIIPEFEELWKKAPGNNEIPPIKYKQPWRLKYYLENGKSSDTIEVQKNWVPFETRVGDDADELFISLGVEGQRIFRVDTSKKFMEYIPSNTPSKLEDKYVKLLEPHAADYYKTSKSESHSCVHDAWKLTERIRSYDIHQSTPPLSVTLCNRGECEPNIYNTVNFAMIHYKNFNSYERAIVTWNVTRPFSFRSVSPPISYLGAFTNNDNLHTIFWTSSMIYYRKDNKMIDRSHGYLDDEIWISFGIEDSAGAFIDIDTRNLLQDHYYCENASLEYRI